MLLNFFFYPMVCSNRAAAFLSLVKLSKALADAETTIKLNPQWEKVIYSDKKRLLLLCFCNIVFVVLTSGFYESIFFFRATSGKALCLKPWRNMMM